MNVCSGMVRRYRQAVLAVMIVVAMAAVAPAQQNAPAQQRPSGSGHWDFLPADAVAILVAYPRRLLTAPELQLMPIEVITALGKQELGIDRWGA